MFLKKEWCKNINIYFTGYNTIKEFDYINIHGANPLHFVAGEVDGYIGNKERMEINTYLFLLQIKAKKDLQNTQNFVIKLKISLKK